MDAKIESHLQALKMCDVSAGYYSLLDILSQKTPNKGNFWEEFESLHIQHEMTIEEKALSSIVSLRENAAKRFLWFEGICLLRLAKVREIEFPALDIP